MPPVRIKVFRMSNRAIVLALQSWVKGAALLRLICLEFFYRFVEFKVFFARLLFCGCRP
jgi:hypothetical protein